MAFTPKFDLKPARPVIDFSDDPGLTKQSMKDDADINFIIEKYNRTGVINFRQNRSGEYLDVSEYPIDFQDAMNTVIKAQDMFNDMPSELRKRFGNDPGTFLDFVHDPANKEALYDLKLAVRPAPANPEGPHTEAEEMAAKASPGGERA